MASSSTLFPPVQYIFSRPSTTNAIASSSSATAGPGGEYRELADDDYSTPTISGLRQWDTPTGTSSRRKKSIRFVRARNQGVAAVQPEGLENGDGDDDDEGEVEVVGYKKPIKVEKRKRGLYEGVELVTCRAATAGEGIGAGSSGQHDDKAASPIPDKKPCQKRPRSPPAVQYNHAIIDLTLSPSPEVIDISSGSESDSPIPVCRPRRDYFTSSDMLPRSTSQAAGIHTLLPPFSASPVLLDKGKGRQNQNEVAVDETTEKGFVPPIQYGIKSTSFGWKMLQKQGWKEGTGLGPLLLPPPPIPPPPVPIEAVESKGVLGWAQKKALARIALPPALSEQDTQEEAGRGGGGIKVPLKAFLRPDRRGLGMPLSTSSATKTPRGTDKNDIKIKKKGKRERRVLREREADLEREKNARRNLMFALNY